MWQENASTLETSTQWWLLSVSILNTDGKRHSILQPDWQDYAHTGPELSNHNFHRASICQWQIHMWVGELYLQLLTVKLKHLPECVVLIHNSCYISHLFLTTVSLSPLSLHSAGMNLSPVARLKKTWSKVKTAKFDVLEVCITFWLYIEIHQMVSSKPLLIAVWESRLLCQWSPAQILWVFPPFQSLLVCKEEWTPALFRLFLHSLFLPI